jgi:hypothetical protein
MTKTHIKVRLSASEHLSRLDLGRRKKLVIIVCNSRTEFEPFGKRIPS